MCLCVCVCILWRWFWASKPRASSEASLLSFLLLCSHFQLLSPLSSLAPWRVCLVSYLSILHFLCTYEQICAYLRAFFFLTWRIHYRYFSELGSCYFTAFSGNRFKSNCRTCPPSPYSCIALRVRGRTPLVDSSPTDGHLGFLPKFEMTDNAVMDSVGQIHVHLVGTAPSEHASRRGTAGSKAHVCVVLSDFAQFPIRIPQQCLRAPVSHKLTNRMYC